MQMLAAASLVHQVEMNFHHASLNISDFPTWRSYFLGPWQQERPRLLNVLLKEFWSEPSSIKPGDALAS